MAIWRPTEDSPARLATLFGLLADSIERDQMRKSFPNRAALDAFVGWPGLAGFVVAESAEYLWLSGGWVPARTEWADLPLGTGIGTPTHGFAPQVRADGEWVHLRGRVERVGGFPAGSTANVFTVPIIGAVNLRPLQAVSLVVAGAGFATPMFARLEVTASGVCQVGCSAPSAWLSLDGARWPRRS